MSTEAEVGGDREAREREARARDPRGAGGGPGPLWRKAPFVLRRFPAVAFAIAASGALLSVTAAAAPLFLSSAGSAALGGELSRISPTAAGLSVFDHEDIDPVILTRHDRLLTERVRQVDGLGEPLRTILGSQAILFPPRPGPGSVGGRLVLRDGALEHVELLTPRAPAASPGIWLANSIAERLGVRPGDDVTLAVRQRAADFAIAGIYRELVTGPGMAPADARFWSPLSTLMASAGSDVHPPPFLLVDDPEVEPMLAFYARLQDSGDVRWEFPIEHTGLTLPRGRRLVRDLRGVLADLDDGSTAVGGALPFATEASSLPAAVQRSDATVAALEGPVGTVSLAGRLLALAVMAAAGLFLVQRRRVEVRSLQARGVGPLSFGARATLEAILPATLGAAAGVAGALLLVRGLGPSPLLDDVARRAAQVQAAGTAVVAVVLLGVVAAFAAREEAVRAGPPREGGGVHWEWVVLALAGASLSEILTRGGGPVLSPSGTPRVDPLLLLFPILLVAGGAGFATRGLVRLLPRLRAAAGRWAPSLFLAARRVAAASRTAVLLVTASASAFGILLYAGTLVASQRATSDAKAYVFAGSDVAVTLPLKPVLPERLPFPATRVTRLPEVEVGTGSAPVLAIEPGTFARTVHWSGSYAEEPLEDLLRRLRPGGPLPLLSVGGSFRGGVTLEVDQLRLPARVVGRADAFPGMPAGEGLLVTSREALEASVGAAGGSVSALDRTEELWGRGSPRAVLNAMREAGVPIEASVTADDVRGSSGFLALSWTFGFLQALGLLAGLVALVGIVLYLQTRQRSREVAYALTRRMGLRRGQHRRAVVAELASMLGIALLIGSAFAGLGAILVNARLDPLPSIPPAPLLRLPWALLGGAGLAALLAAWLGAWWVQRAADRANVAEVMRLAG